MRVARLKVEDLRAAARHHIAFHARSQRGLAPVDPAGLEHRGRREAAGRHGRSRAAHSAAWLGMVARKASRLSSSAFIHGVWCGGASVPVSVERWLRSR